MTEYVFEPDYPASDPHVWMGRMSQPSPGPGWWLASDGRWYPPQTAPVSAVLPPLGLPPMPVPVSVPSAQPGQAAMPYYAGVGQPGTAYPYPYIPGPPLIEPKTSPMAIWALVLVILLGAIGALVGIPLAFVARSRIRQSGGALKGSGLALAALIIGFAFFALALFAVAIPTFLGVTHAGPSIQNLDYSVQGQINGTASNDFGDPRVSNVVCSPPSQWTTGSAFVCTAYATAPIGAPASEVGRYYGTVVPNAPDGTYQWNGRYVPSA